MKIFLQSGAGWLDSKGRKGVTGYESHGKLDAYGIKEIFNSYQEYKEGVHDTKDYHFPNDYRYFTSQSLINFL